EDTPCGIAVNIGREGEDSRILTLGELKTTVVDMFTTVFVGNSVTRVIGGKLVTPRGYRL
ncbi:MAG: precorrin-3B C(17)-methyltransferase, partial [Ruminiclostridium sp.]|nr:precorrin-3B C(17)-methyltransferase [Ruminiclostridium sp.]